jgi:hypothetical protein
MSAPVDVLAVMRAACNDEGDWMPKLVESHNAVSDLLRAVTAYKDASGKSPIEVREARRLMFSQLARCGGAK